MSKVRDAAQAAVAAFELHGYSPLTIGAIWTLRDALPDVPGLVEATGLSNWQIGRALNISSRAVKNWRHGGRITPESYAKLQEFCK